MWEVRARSYLLAMQRRSWFFQGQRYNVRKRYSVPQGDTVQDSAEYVIRMQGNRAYTFGLGEIISSRVAFFKAGNYDLTHEQLNAKLKALGKVTLGN